MAAAEAQIEGGAVAKKKGVPKLFIIIGAAVIVALLGAGALFFMLAGKPAAEEGAHGATEDGAHGGEHGADAEVHHSFIFNLPPMMVNLNTEGGEPAFMRLSIALEVADEAMMATIQPRLAKVIDAFQVYLRELRKSDLEGSAGIYRLKEELLRRVNTAIYPSEVQSILFKEILVQ